MNHSVVEYTDRVMPDHVPSQNCQTHKGMKYIYWCENCQQTACFDCVTSLHRGHTFAKLDVILKEQRSILQSQLEQMESSTLKEWQFLLIEVQKATSEFLSRANEVEKKLEEKAKELHLKVDDVLRQSKQQLADLNLPYLEALNIHEKLVSSGLQKVLKDIRECENQLRNGDMESLLQYKGHQTCEEETLPTITREVQNVPIFTPGRSDVLTLSSMFGKLSQAPQDKMTASDHTQSTRGISFKAVLGQYHSIR